MDAVHGSPLGQDSITPHCCTLGISCYNEGKPLPSACVPSGYVAWRPMVVGPTYFNSALPKTADLGALKLGLVKNFAFPFIFLKVVSTE